MARPTKGERRKCNKVGNFNVIDKMKGERALKKAITLEEKQVLAGTHKYVAEKDAHGKRVKKLIKI